jgi:hypothetical protein
MTRRRTATVSMHMSPGMHHVAVHSRRARHGIGGVGPGSRYAVARADVAHAGHEGPGLSILEGRVADDDQISQVRQARRPR